MNILWLLVLLCCCGQNSAGNSGCGCGNGSSNGNGCGCGSNRPPRPDEDGCGCGSNRPPRPDNDDCGCGGRSSRPDHIGAPMPPRPEPRMSFLENGCGCE